MKKSMLLLGIGCLTAGIAAAETPNKESVEAKNNDATELEAVDVVSSKQKKKSQSRAEQDKLPQTTESITREKAEENINAMNTEDLIKYMPSITVRKRYIGDTNAPVATRTTTMSQSARSLIYADGILLSSLLGNNNTSTGSPLWNLVSPSEVERIDMMYGPFSAAYAGNSVGGVLDITTRMPEKFEASANVQSTWQDYNYLGHKNTYDAQQYSASAGDRMGSFSWRFNYSHLDSHSQPITFFTTTKATAGTTGAVVDKNTYNQPIFVTGEGNINHTIQDNFKWKLAYDITPTIKASYTLGLWLNDANAGVNSFLTKTTTGNPTYNYTPSTATAPNTAAAMVGNIVEQRRWSHGLSLKSDSGGLFDWSLSGSLVDYGKDLTLAPVSNQLNLNSLLPVNGTINSMTGTGWHTADAKGIWRPKTSWANHEVSLGYHHDLYELSNPIYNTAYWNSGVPTTINSASYGKTQTNAVWLQDILAFNPQWQLTIGGRLENWNAYDGVNMASATKVTNQANHSALKFSPKASLKWSPDNNWQVTASIGHAYRFPTVNELYQTAGSGSGVTATIANPNLKPENTLASELATQYTTDSGKLRVSFFQERTNNLIAGQTTNTPTVFGGNTYQYLNTNQNVGQVNTYGIEISGEKQEVGRYLGIEGLDFSANGTWVDSRIAKDGNNGMIVSSNSSYTSAATCPGTWSTTAKNCQVNVIGKRQPRLPEFRANATLTYHPIKPLSLSTSVRYSSQQYGQLDNSDTNHYTYTGITSFLVADVRFRYEITKQLALSGGIDNVNNEKYILFHPFPGRTYSAELKFNY